jgi:hypothetical protein
MASNYQPARGALFRTRGLGYNSVSIFVVPPEESTLKSTKLSNSQKNSDISLL